MKRLYVFLILVFLFITIWWIGALPVSRSTTGTPNQILISLSGNLLYAVKTEDNTDSLEKELSIITPDDLINGLSNDTARKTFWINIYNAYYQLLATREQKTKPEIFTGRLINIAGQQFSLDDIEHGILRRYRWKYSMGYLSQFLPSKRIKKLAVDVIDYRIHFALNCGARSCPPIAFYKYDNLEKQLDIAAISFLKNETTIDTVKKELHTSKILQWFKGDFGGKKGIIVMLSEILQKDFTGYKLQFKEYDWTKNLRNYNTE